MSIMCTSLWHITTTIYNYNIILAGATSIKRRPKLTHNAKQFTFKEFLLESDNSQKENLNTTTTCRH